MWTRRSFPNTIVGVAASGQKKRGCCSIERRKLKTMKTSKPTDRPRRLIIVWAALVFTILVLPGGGSPAVANFGPNDLWLEIFYGTNSAPITLHNTTTGVRYQLLSRPEVAQPPWLVEQTLFGAPGANTPTTVLFNERPLLFFWAGVDSDGDGLIDYLETLNGTDPQNPDTDLDGVNDYVEFIQGRNPNDPNGAVPDTTGLVNLQVYTPLR